MRRLNRSIDSSQTAVSLLDEASGLTRISSECEELISQEIEKLNVLTAGEAKAFVQGLDETHKVMLSGLFPVACD